MRLAMAKSIISRPIARRIIAIDIAIIQTIIPVFLSLI